MTEDKYVWIFDEGWEEIGKVWVDSGQIAIADPCYVLSKEEYNETFIRNYKQQPHEFKRGVVTSGFGGDGNFPILVKKNKEGLILELKIILDRESPEYHGGKCNDNCEVDCRVDHEVEKIPSDDCGDHSPYKRFEDREAHNEVVALIIKLVGKELDGCNAETILYINHLIGELQR